MSMIVKCPHCFVEQRDCTNGYDVREWWTGHDNDFDVKCDRCEESFVVRSNWTPEFIGMTEEDAYE